MKVLVIGGTRYFGKRFVHKLVEAGHQVSILSRGQNPDDFGASVTRLLGDRTNESSLQSAVKNLTFDCVIDQVAMTEQDARIACDIFNSKTNYYLFTSTLSVYPQHGDLKETAFDPLNYLAKTPQDAGEAYAEGKRAAERCFTLKGQFKLGIMRIPVVVGPDDYTQRLYKQVQSVKNGVPIFFPNLEARFGFIQSEDAARALMWMTQEQREGIFNFASPDAPQLSELVSLIERAVNKKAILSKDFSEAHHSPFGVSNDWYLNVDKAAALGFKCPLTNEWLPQLVQSL